MVIKTGWLAAASSLVATGLDVCLNGPDGKRLALGAGMATASYFAGNLAEQKAGDDALTKIAIASAAFAATKDVYGITDNRSSELLASFNRETGVLRTGLDVSLEENSPFLPRAYVYSIENKENSTTIFPAVTDLDI